LFVRYIQLIAQQYDSEKHLCNKEAIIKYTDDFCYEKESSCTITKLTLFVVSKDQWNTKEDTGKSMKNALYILQYGKSTPGAEATSKGEKIKPVALAIKLR